MLKKIVLAILMSIIAIWFVALVWPEKTYQPHVPADAYQVEAKAYLEKNLKPLPANWQWGEFVAEDGKVMRWGHVAPEAAAVATVVFVPGYTGALEMYAPYFHKMLARNIEVYGFDLRGQGGSARMLKNPEKPWVEDFGQYSEDLKGFITSMKAEASGPIYLMGESFGGHVSLRATGDYDLPVQGLVLVAPAMQIQTAPYDYKTAQNIVEAMRGLGFGKRYAIGQSNWQPYTTDLSQGNYCGNNTDRIHVKDTLYTFRPELRVGGTTNQWIAEIMESSAHITNPDYLAEISTPVLLATPDNDMIVKADVSKNACANDIPNCQAVILPNSGHCTVSEKDVTQNQLFDAVLAFVEEISG